MGKLYSILQEPCQALSTIAVFHAECPLLSSCMGGKKAYFAF